jgi:hypothetical protein
MRKPDVTGDGVGFSAPRLGQIALASSSTNHGSVFASDTKSEMTSKPRTVYDPKPMAYKAVRVCFPTEIGHRPSNLVNPRQLATDDV